jgi:hypothetical protein
MGANNNQNVPFWRSLFGGDSDELKVIVPTLHDQPSDFENLFQLLKPIDDRLTAGIAPRVVVDFSPCRFLQQNAVILLGGMARAVISRGGTVRFLWDTLEPAVRLNLSKNGFLSAFGQRVRVEQGNTIPYREHGKPQKDEVIDYLRKEWLKPRYLNLSPQLRDALAGNLWEIYANADEHSSSPIGVISCGQFYPVVGKLKLTIVDFGIGIPQSIREFFGRPIRADRALMWAFKPGTTTKTDIGRGLGLSLVKDLVMANKGRLEVFSNEGHFRLDGAGEVYQERRGSFSGTIITVELCRDNIYYCFASEAGRRRRERNE